jgi:multidrug efflux pump subunit AcrB
MASSGAIDIGTDRLPLYTTGKFQDIEDIRNALVPTKSGGSVRIRDFAEVRRGYVEPLKRQVRFGEQREGRAVPCLGLAISVVPGGNVVEMGKAVQLRLNELIADLPVGIEVRTIANQPDVVVSSIREFSSSLLQAVVIVLIVLFIGLGRRVGVIVSAGIPMTILATFIGMSILDIDLQRISLGALIIALGMLVDNSIVVCEMFMTRVQAGHSRMDAGVETFKQAALPLLTATLTSIAAFLPVYLSPDSMGEYCSSLFIVVALALGLSWFIAFTITSLNCFWFIKVPQNPNKQDAVNHGNLTRVYKKLLGHTLKRRWAFLLVTAFIFFCSVWGFGFVPRQFMAPSVQPKFLVYLKGPDGTMIRNTINIAEEVESFLLGNKKVVNVASFIGEGLPRFALPVEPGPSGSSLAELIVNTRSYGDNNNLKEATRKFIHKNFPDTDFRVYDVPMGGGGVYKIAWRLTGPNADVLREKAQLVKAMMSEDPRCKNINDDWGRRAPSFEVLVDLDSARRARTTSSNIAAGLQNYLEGDVIDIFREGIRQIPVVMLTSAPEERDSIQMVFSAQVPDPSGLSSGVQIQQVATPELDWIDYRIRRRDKRPTIEARCNPIESVTAEEIRRDLEKRIHREIKLPSGYMAEWGGEYENSNDSNSSVIKFLPLALGIMVLTLIIQFNSFRRTTIIFLTLPLAVIGVTIGLLVFWQPFGFIALLGLMSLLGIVINNGIVMIDQIDTNIHEGTEPARAILQASLSRFRPILLSATTTVLGMIPLLLSGPFWRPMAVVIMCGLLFGTLLTLFIVPALYSLLFHIRMES